MPVLGDLQERLKENHAAYRIGVVLKRFVSGSAQSFNRQTNVDLSNKYIVLDLSELNGKLLPVGMMIALEFCLGQNKIGQDEEKSCVYRRDMETRRSVFQRNGGRVLPEHLQDNPRLRRRGDCRHAGFVRLFRAV